FQLKARQLLAAMNPGKQTCTTLSPTVRAATENGPILCSSRVLNRNFDGSTIAFSVKRHFESALQETGELGVKIEGIFARAANNDTLREEVGAIEWRNDSLRVYLPKSTIGLLGPRPFLTFGNCFEPDLADAMSPRASLAFNMSPIDKASADSPRLDI